MCGLVCRRLLMTYHISALLVVIGVGMANSQNSLPVKEYEEICETKFFKPKCEKDHLILMTHAQYGRMKQGTCVKENYGHIGCGANVLKITDSRCSGRQSCSIGVPDTEFARVTPCPEDLKPYLQVSYRCVKVHTPHHMCPSNEPIPITSPSGFLTSNVTSKTNCGTDTSPWQIQSKKGQHITITLFDFTSHHTSQGYCFAKIRDYSDKRGHDLRICRGGNREKVVLRTNSTKVEVIMQDVDKNAKDRVSYMLRYEVDGCPDPIPPPHAWVARTGDDVVIKCNFTKESTHLRCKGKKWDGRMINCSTGAATYMEPENIPFEVSILIVLIIALVIGLVVLILGLLFLKRQHSSCFSRPSHIPEAHNKDYMTASYYQTSTYAPKPPPQNTGSEMQPCTPLMGQSRESAYGQLPPPTERLACGCPVYMTRDEMQNQQNIHNQSFPPCSAKMSTNAADVLSSCSAGNNERVVIGPDMLPLNERQLFVNTLERSPKRFHHTTFKPIPGDFTISRDLNLPTRENKENSKQCTSIIKNKETSQGSRPLLKNNSDGSGDHSDSEASAFMPRH